YSDQDVDLDVELQAKYGDDFAKIKAKARDFAETIHQYNDLQEQELMNYGLLRDPAKVARLEAELAALREEAKAANAIGEFDAGQGADGQAKGVDRKKVKAAR